MAEVSAECKKNLVAGQKAFKAGNLDGALDMAKRALKADGDSYAPVHLLFGAILTAQEDYEMAERVRKTHRRAQWQSHNNHTAVQQRRNQLRSAALRAASHHHGITRRATQHMRKMQQSGTVAHSQNVSERHSGAFTPVQH